MKAKIEYEKLKENGELFDLFPDFLGSWDEDKYEFLQLYKLNKKALKKS